jgi:hypothetical protein
MGSQGMQFSERSKLGQRLKLIAPRCGPDRQSGHQIGEVNHSNR